MKRSSAVVFVNTKDAAKLLEQKLRTWKFRRLDLAAMKNRCQNTAKGGISDQPQLVDGISSINSRVDLEVRSGLHRIEIWVLIWNLTHHSCNLFCASEMEQFEFCKWYRNWKTCLLEIAFLLDQALRFLNFSHLHSTLFFRKKRVCVWGCLGISCDLLVNGFPLPKKFWTQLV